MEKVTIAVSAEGRVKSMAEHDGCKGCAYVSRGEHEAPCVKCAQNASDNYKIMTNADRIRSMTDMQLILFICEIADCKKCHAYDMCVEYGVVTGREMWMQSEAEE